MADEENKDNLEIVAEQLLRNNELKEQELELKKMDVEANVKYIKMLENYVASWADKITKEGVLEKLDNIENKLDNFVIGTNVDIINNLIPIPWKVNTNYERDMIVSYEGSIYKVIQTHTSQANWTPDIFKAGFALIATPEDVEEVVEQGNCPAFIQPLGAQDAYKIDDCVMFEGKNYVSLINNNTWSPKNYAAGWKLRE